MKHMALSDECARLLLTMVCIVLQLFERLGDFTFIGQQSCVFKASAGLQGAHLLTYLWTLYLHRNPSA